MRLKLHTIVFMLGLTGCATHPAPVTADIESSYKNSISAPEGYGRIYVLPPINGLFGTKHEITARISVGKNDDAKVVAGEVSKDRFTAFDVQPGNLDIVAINSEGYSHSDQVFEIKSGETIALRPLAYYNGGAFGLIGLAITGAINDGKKDYEIIENDKILDLVKNKTLTSIAPEAKDFIEQK